MPERTIAFRIDDALHKRIKMRLIETNKTLKDYVIDLIVADLENESAKAPVSAKAEFKSDMQEFFNEFMDFVLAKQAEQNNGEKK